MVCKRNAAWVAEQEAAAREMRLANIKLQIRAGAYETPARILGTVQKLKEVLMPKHTPEPWVVTRKETANYYPDFYIKSDGFNPRVICKVTIDSPADDLANLALLQAAPKLLAACREALGVIGLPLASEDRLKISEQICAAIEAAEREIQCR